VYARLDGDRWVLNGEKSEWISSTPIATHTTLFVSVEGEKGLDRGLVAVVPLDFPGVSRARPLDKAGVRALPQGSCCRRHRGSGHA
jgi:acyl-CoA dehydrogenase